MEETIFRVHPGLKRRFMWYFNIEPYSNESLACVIHKQAMDDGWLTPGHLCEVLGKLKDVTIPWLTKLVAQNKDYFGHYGGDTAHLGFCSAIEHACQCVLNPDLEKKESLHIILSGLEQLKTNTKKKESPPAFMYG